MPESRSSLFPFSPVASPQGWKPPVFLCPNSQIHPGTERQVAEQPLDGRVEVTGGLWGFLLARTRDSSGHFSEWAYRKDTWENFGRSGFIIQVGLEEPGVQGHSDPRQFWGHSTRGSFFRSGVSSPIWLSLLLFAWLLLSSLHLPQLRFLREFGWSC